MSRFPTQKHFASHLGLCLNNQITGGKMIKRKTRKVQSRAAIALRIAPQSLHRSPTALGAFFRRMRARLGPAKAITATAQKLAELIYRMLKHGQAYVDKGQDAYAKGYNERPMKNLLRQARNLGCEILIVETGEIVSRRGQHTVGQFRRCQSLRSARQAFTLSLQHHKAYPAPKSRRDERV